MLNNNPTAHSVALYPGQFMEDGTRKIHSLTPYLCGYYPISLIINLHSLWSTASSVFRYRIQLSFSNLSPDILRFVIHAFSASLSRLSLKHVHTISNYFPAALSISSLSPSSKSILSTNNVAKNINFYILMI